jgi:formate dehydrogenase maturation protein FdhE
MLDARRPTVTVIASTLCRPLSSKSRRGPVRIIDREKLEAAWCECHCTTTDLIESVTRVIMAGVSGAWACAGRDDRCPHCGGAPQVSILDADLTSGDGGRRQLQCAGSLTTWPFRRVVRAYCGEDDERKLAHFESPTFAHVRVDACDGCGRYLKSVGLTRLGLEVPLVDEIAAAPLDAWAIENGYEKIELNFVGL